MPRAGLAVGAGDDDDVAVGVTEPGLAVLRVRIDVRLLQELGAQGPGPLDRGVEVLHLEPEQDAVAGRSSVGVDEVRVLLIVQLCS